MTFTANRCFSRFTIGFLSSVMMNNTNSSRSCSEESAFFLFSNHYHILKTDITMSQSNQKSEKTFFKKILELRIKVCQHFFPGHGNQTFLKKTKSGFLFSFCFSLGFWSQH